MKALKYLWLREHRAVCASLGFWLSAALLQAGEPIVFVRQASPANAAQIPVKQVDKRVATALDALEAPSPLDGAFTGPAAERPRQSRDPSRARKAELARKEKNWMLADEKDPLEEEDDRILNDKEEFDADEHLPTEKDQQRPSLRPSASERRAEERDSRVPAHLLSPQVRQRMQLEALRRQGQASSGDSESGLSGGANSGIDLAKMLTPSEETKLSAAMVRMKQLTAPEGGTARRETEPNELGSAGGSELVLGPNITGPRLGPDLGEGRFGSSLLDRSSDPERAGSPSKGLGPGEVPRSYSAFPSLRDDFRSSVSPTLPGNTIGPSARELPSLDDLTRPRRGGQLGR